MNNITFTKILLILIILQGILLQYPEDYSTIELLTNPENKDNSNGDEIYLDSYYHTKDSSSLQKCDYRNGILILPKDFSDSIGNSCTNPTSYSGNDDNEWKYATNTNIFFPPSLGITSAYCINSASNNINLNLISFIDSDSSINVKYKLSYIFYFWIHSTVDTDNTISFSCFDTAGSISFLSTTIGIYQFYLRYNYENNIFTDIDNTESSSFQCSSMKIRITSTSQIALNRIKVSMLVQNDIIISIDCNDVERKCPYSYYCDINSGQCKKCLGLYANCQNRKIGSKCGRFTKDWINVGPTQTECIADYFNLQNIGEMSFDITPPIKSNAVSLSFWLFTLTDKNEYSSENDIKLYHISLEDFYVVTIVPGESKYTVYLTAYQMYHEAYKTDIQKIKTLEEFKNLLNEFPYTNWFINCDINKINRWVNIIVSFNKNLARIGMQVFYKKRVDSYGSLIVDSYKKYKNLDGEYIYRNENYKSKLHFKKFYRNSDVMHLNVNIYNNNIGVFIRNIYTYASELLITSSSNSQNLFGFQYIEYEKIFPVSNYLMPELVLAIPFDQISKSDSNDNQYSIEYYMYDMTRINNNRKTKNLIINPGDIEDSLYDYDPRLYRLNLLFEKNQFFKDSYLIDKETISCYSNVDYCYLHGYPYVCNSGYFIESLDHTCVQNSLAKILVPGINAEVNQRGMLTDVCYGNEGSTCGEQTITQYKCETNSFKLFDACISGSFNEDKIGYFYYSYFFQLPPIKINLQKAYTSYYIQFNFLYETNSALRPQEKFKGKKIYIFYTDAFKIWHDYSMKYLGIEDNQNNPSKNLIQNFNTENENIFTISVKYDTENNVYKGKIFMNGVKIYTPSFTGGKLSYILFCHNDTACPVNNKVYWTSGFYNHIKIYDLESLTILNDNSFYDQYIYNNYYSYYNYQNLNDRFDSYPATEEIKMNLGDMKNYNKIGNYEITSYYANDDKMQMFNYGIDQTIPLRNLGTNFNNNKYISSSFTDETCPNSISCYGGSNFLSGEAQVCDNTKYYKYDTCEAFPTSPKNKYFTLTLPLKEYINGEYIDYSLSSINYKNNDDIQGGKITFSFWLKLIGFNGSKRIFQTGAEDNICYLEYTEINKISLVYIESSQKKLENYYLISERNYGKYMHINIAISIHKYLTKKNYFISFQVNNMNVEKKEDCYDYLNTDATMFLNIKKFILYTGIYAQIAKFYIYNEALIGGYAYNTNKYFNLEPVYKIIDDNRENCLYNNDNTNSYFTNYNCINDYDPVFNDDNYISYGYPLDQKVYLTNNNQFKIKSCSDKCGSFCYGIGEDQCACATKGYFDYIFKKEDFVYECRKLPYLDYKRYNNIKFSLPSNYGMKGFDFWFYSVKGVNDYSTSTDLYKIKCELNHLVLISIDGVNCYNEKVSLDTMNKWLHVYCYYDNNYNIKINDYNNNILGESSYSSGWSMSCQNIEFINFEDGENKPTSPGIMLIRQFKIWRDISKKEDEMDYIEYTSNFNKNNVLLTIDSLINPDKSFKIYTSPELLITLTKSDLNNEVYYGYYPIEEEIPELELCSETEECKPLLNLKAIEDLEFENITPSGTGRYTMEFWIKIKSIKKFLNGTNLIWKGLISISLLTDTLRDRLVVYCFPQDYLNSPSNYKGRNIINLALSSLNSDNFDLSIENYDNVWFYTRCAYNWDNEIYYLKYNGNSVIPKSINHEHTSEIHNVDYPFKYLFNEYESYHFYIQNAKLNPECDIYIRTLYLFNEYLPQEYDTQRVLFTSDNKVTWLVFGIDFFDYEKVEPTENKIKLTFLKKNEDESNTAEFEILDINNYYSRGGIVLCEANKNLEFNSETNECKEITTSVSDSEISVKYGNIPLQCKSGYYLAFTNTAMENSCNDKCPSGFNRGPGSLLDMDSPSQNTALCNYILDSNHQYNDPLNFKDKMTCPNGYVRVGYKCFNENLQINSAIYFNRCYNFYPVFAYFEPIKLKFINGYIFEFSFKIDLVNDFCSKEGIKERFIIYAHPHSIFQNQNEFYYKDTNYINNNEYIDHKLTQVSLYEWNHFIIEFRPKEFKVNIYINYNMNPAYSYTIEEEDLNNYYLRNLVFCTGDYLCAPIEPTKLNWGAAYYSKMRIYDLKHSSVYMVYENMRNKFNYDSESILVYYLFNTINNDLNIFYDKYNNINLDFNGNRPIISVYNSDDKTLMFSSSSNFDYGEYNPGQYAEEVTLITGKYRFKGCSDGCKRCYSSKKNDCYECKDGFELYNNQCREITGYYFQLPNYNNEEIEIKTGSTLKDYNPITVTLWVKYYGKIKDFEYNDGNTCILLIRFSTEDNIFICHEQEYNNLLMYRNNINLYNDTLFLENLGTWQLLSISNYKCSLNNGNTCNFYPSMFSFAINGQVLTRRSTYNIPTNGIILNKITFGYGIIMMIADLNIYNAFILNPLGVISNFLSYKKYLISSLNFHLSSSSNCIDKQILISYNGRDMYYQQNEHCIPDYNIYNEIEKHNCDSEDKMININSIENECLDCIDECTHCAGDSKFNCACYNNENYWFRNDNSINRLYCQLVPYIDLNKYSDLQFNEIKYATTNEFAIEFWYFIYEYNATEINFYKQVISWENHIKIEISKYSNNAINVECFPINEKDESVSTNDVSQKYFQWNHIICATDLNNKVYYLNDLKINNIIGEAVKQLNYSTYEDRKVILRFQSYNYFDDKTSTGVFLLKELRLWNFFSIREFNTKCYYNYNWAKNNDIPNILHYFPFNMKKDGIVKDSKGNVPSQEILKNNIIGYNIIDYENKYNIDETFEECLVIYVLPSRIYFNLTNVLIYNYEIEPKVYPYYNYKYEFAISQNASVLFKDIKRTNLNTENNQRELLLKKFKDNKYNGIQLNLYITLTEIDSNKKHYGFNIIKINSYYPGYDIDLETFCKGLYDNLEVDLDNLENKYEFTEVEIWNRLYLLQSLGDIHNMALNESNRTTSFLDYYYDEDATSYFPENIVIKNPICYDDYCSGKGKCIIIVRSMICLCDEGYSGRNCHITNKNKNYLSGVHLSLWNYLTNNNEFSTLSIDNKFLYEITYLIKSSTIFDDSYNDLIKNFFNLINYLKQNNLDLILSEINLIFDTISFILINMYYDTQQFRAKNYDNITENANYTNDEKIEEVNLNNKQIDAVYDISYKITNIIPEFILTLIKLNKKDIFENYTAFDYTIKSVSHSFDYMEYFNNLHINNREKYNSYLPYIDAYNCSDYIFGSTSYSTIFLVIINYHYDPLSYQSVYSYSASYSLDIFYATQIGTKLDVKACPNYIDIYFPLTLYNESEIEFINSHAKFLSENTDSTVNDPYITWPVYVHKNGSVSRKSRYERINEVLPMIKINCSYYNNKLTLSSNISNTIVSEKFYLICQTNHLSFYTIQSESSGLDYKLAGIFFYLGAPQVFICGSNWSNGCTILLLISLLIFAFFIILFMILEKTLMITKNSLNNIKLEILKQNRLIYDELDLIEEITKANKMNEQENMAKNLKIELENDKYDKDLKQNLYLYGTKNIDYNDLAFEGGDKGDELDKGYAGKGVFGNPPKKQKSGFIIDDIDDMDNSSDSEEKETRIKKSVNILRKKKSRQKSKIKQKPKTQDYKKGENSKKEEIENRFYKVKDYNPDKTNQVNHYNYNLYKESDFGFNESENSEDNDNNRKLSSKEDKKSEKISYKDLSIKESTDELINEEKKKTKKKKKKDENSEEKKDKEEDKKDNKNDDKQVNGMNTMQYNDDESDRNENLDYFSKYKSVIKNENKKGKKVNIQKGNYTIVDKYRKVTFVKEKYYSLDILGFFEHIDKKNPSVIKLFWYLFLRRNIYLSPFMVSSTINPRWKRILSLYIYILLQILILTFGLSIAERLNINNTGKIFLFQLITIFLADMISLIMIPLFRIPTSYKKMLFFNFKSTQQIKLLKIFKTVKDAQKKKFSFIVAIIIFIFLATFYFSFNYCSVLYYSRWLFVECLFVGILLDFVLYEGVLNGLICLFYFLKGKKKIFIRPYVYLFLFRNYRTCF